MSALLLLLACTRPVPSDSAADTGAGPGHTELERATSVAFRAIGSPTSVFDRLEEQGQARGLQWEHANLPADAPHAIGASLVALDLEGDGDLDLAVSHPAGEPHLFVNDGTGQFTSIPPTRQWATDIRDLVTGLAAVDLSGDGLPDLLLLSARRVMWMKNDGGVLADPVDLWVEDAEVPTAHFGVGIGDIDGDGDLDFVLPGADFLDGPDARALAALDDEPGSPALLLRRSGEGVVAERPFPPDSAAGFSFLALPTQADDDPALELLIGSDRPTDRVRAKTQLFDVDGEDWRDTAVERGFALPLDAMGIASWDWNDDGRLDHVISDFGHPTALQSTGSQFVRAGEALGLRVPVPPDEIAYWFGWSVEAVDLQADGVMDLAMSAGWALTPPDGFGELAQPNALWRGHADGPYEQRASAVGFDRNSHDYGLVAEDFDGNGAPEIVVAGLSGLQLWHNPDTVGHAVWVSLAGPPGNPTALGAMISVDAGSRRHMREVRGPRALAQGSGAVHFGLGAVDHIDAITVAWPDGTVDRWEDLAVGRRWTLAHEGSP